MADEALQIIDAGHSSIGGRSDSMPDEFEAAALRAEERLQHQAVPSGIRGVIKARAARGLCKAKVSGVGIPCLCRRKLVVDLSTQRSMLRAELTTGTPISASACSTPSRSVTASNVPRPMARTSARSGNCGAETRNDDAVRPARVEAAGGEPHRHAPRAEPREGAQHFPRMPFEASTKSAICGAAVIL